MTLPKRLITIEIDPAQQTAFAAALQRWQNAEPLLQGVQVFGTQVKAWLQPVLVVDGPKAGTWHDDRHRALTMFRDFIPGELVRSVEFEGRDWRAR